MFDFKLDLKNVISAKRAKALGITTSTPKAQGRTSEKLRSIYRIPAEAPQWTSETPVIIVESTLCGCCGGVSRTATLFYKSQSLRDKSAIRFRRADVARKPFDTSLAEVSYREPIHAPFCADCVEAAISADGKFAANGLSQRQRDWVSELASTSFIGE